MRKITNLSIQQQQQKLIYLSSTIAPKWLGQIATAGVGGKILLGGRR